MEKDVPNDPIAYEYYLNGKFHMGLLTKESQQTALDYFVKATDTDPESHKKTLSNEGGVNSTSF